MSKIIAVTSGKGGTGKSSISACLGYALAKQGNRTLIIELDFGLRCMDIMLGMQGNITYDLGDVLEGTCDVYKATTTVKLASNLSVLCAPSDPFVQLKAEDIEKITQEMRKYFEYIIIDTSAGINGSVFDIVAAQDAQRGGRRHAGIIDEVRDHDGDMLNSVVLPLMNVNRRTVNGELNINEPHQAQIYISSAGSKNSYAYERMKELMVNSVIDASQAFVWGCDYRIPVMAGLIPKTYVSELKMSGTFKEDDFAREYMSIWTGGSSDSWINFDTLVRHRVVVNTEFKAKNNAQKLGYNTEQFYILSIDVARLCAETTICVFKVLAHENGFTKKLVNLEVLPEKLHFEHQAARIKEMIVAYQPKEVVIDGYGLGVGLMDYMIQYSRHDLTKQVYPPYGSFNDEDYLQKQPRDCQKLIYVMKAGATNQGVINSTCFSELVSGKVHFLIREQDAKDRLLATEKGMKMPIEMRIRKLRPYTLQGILIEEILNMRIKDGNINQNNLTLERINTGMSKDKFSAFEYGLYRIKEHEMQYMKRKSRQKRDLKQFMLFSSRGGGK